jgi:hypothetical protein
MKENKTFEKEKNNNNELNPINSIKKLFGLPNIGESCYMNSFLNILLHTPHFLETLKESYEESYKEKSDPLIDSLIKISEKPKKESLKQIKAAMAEEDKSFGKIVQNDSQEFGVILLNKIITKIKGDISFEEDSNEDETNIQIDKDYKIQKFEIFKNKYCKEDKKLEEMFQFQEIMFNIDPNETKIGYYKSIYFNNFFNIDLTFPNKNNNNSYSLIELMTYKYPKNPLNQINQINKEDISALHNLFRIFINFLLEYKFFQKIFHNFGYDKNNNENVENDENHEDNNLFYSNLASLPNILIISINRAFLRYNIFENTLSFEETLDLKDYLDEAFLDKEKETKYKLYGVNLCEKSWFFNAGHYYSYVKINDKWYKFDDNKPVEEISPVLESKYVTGLYYVKEKFI